MTLSLIQDNHHSDLARLEVTTTTQENFTEIGCILNLAPAWLPLGQGQGKITLHSVGVHLELSADGGVETLHPLDAPPTTISPNHYSWHVTTEAGTRKLAAPLLTVRSPVSSLTAKITVNFSQLHLTETRSLWPYELSPNRVAVLRRAIAKQLWTTRFADYLSCVSPQISPTLPHSHPVITQEVIERIVAAPSDRFTDLVALTDLDLSQDFVGSILLGVNFNEAELSGVNLSQTNLRGAELCDVDLRDATLSGTNLQGADLSGALLENANLSQANCFRTSLALANLASADLSQANLTEANLTQTNWSGATVTQMQLGNNPGLTAEMKQTLLGRGAIAI